MDNSAFKERMKVPVKRQTNSRKPSIKTNPKTSSKVFTRNSKIGIRALAGILAAGLISVGAIHRGNAIYNEEMSRNIQEEIREETLAEFSNYKQYSDVWDGQSFSISVPCTRPELYNVLTSSKFDEIFNTYFANPTTQNRESLIKKLEGKESELAKFVMDVIRASFADSLQTTSDNINIDVTFIHDSDEQRAKIANGTKPYEGSTLRISSPDGIVESYSARGIYNYNQIPQPIAKLLANARGLEEAPHSSFFDSEISVIERLIRTYQEVKGITNNYNFAIKSGKVCLADNTTGKPFNYNPKLNGRPGFEIIKDIDNIEER